MSARRRARALIPVSLRVHRAERHWQNLALRAGLAACDERLCAKLAKIRKHGRRAERRAVRQLLTTTASLGAA